MAVAVRFATRRRIYAGRISRLIVPARTRALVAGHLALFIAVLKKMKIGGNAVMPPAKAVPAVSLAASILAAVSRKKLTS